MARRSRWLGSLPEQLPTFGELSEPVILAAANWARDTALIFGASTSTAFTVAGIMAQGLEAELRRRQIAEAQAPGGAGGTEG